MNRYLSSTALTLLTLLACAHTARAEGTLSHHAVVHDKNGAVVRAIGNGTCVRTKWDVGYDECAPAQTRTITSQTILSDGERTIYFAFDSAALTPDAEMTLNSTIKRLSSAQDVVSAQIVGYADRLGASAYNQKLSVRRADAVKNYLVQHGYLAVEVTTTAAMGETEPVTTCPTSANTGKARANEINCLSPDRRVEIQLVYAKDIQTSSR